ncbi:sugar-binding transcriptional regulator [Vibrio brasiliensis]|jgi:DNA-binding transcriptional regulator LsrR (DeoR family)|uniref:sugar-binding transcriptional regulator n=1 Tax=Vibrio brasiliensis TaxID=170652 RepID=UPI001EFE8DA8|nr:sugar-binding transcriptional regulator [Vibrio brasiliensis]MCG9724923.1 sugar-binding transcriptional regulator [Vibrio brasiliensis]MCG9750850.1 sugar-binding transcriptional regulator [Vibrio brasiliensis]MCG9783151.1 sugar-binding transcriptional regulator [Vibrio brasiliensis]
MANNEREDILRQTAKILTLRYMENRSQSEIAKQLGLSSAKVNRVIKQAHDDGLVEITLNLPQERTYSLEQRLLDMFSLKTAHIQPSHSQDETIVTRQVAQCAGELLIETIKPNSVICISGGKTMSMIVEQLKPMNFPNVRVVPATGGVQGHHFTDVNYLASRLAEKLGGTSTQLHAPLFVDTDQQREMLMEMRSVKEVLDIARNADIALVGIGSVASETDSYYDLRTLSGQQFETQIGIECRGEVLAHLYDEQGRECAQQINSKLIGLNLKELGNIEHSFGIAATQSKVAAMLAALRGGLINGLVSDEDTIASVIEQAK